MPKHSQTELIINNFIIFTHDEKYCGDQITTDDISGVQITFVYIRDRHEILVGNSEGKYLLARGMLKVGDNIETHL